MDRKHQVSGWFDFHKAAYLAALASYAPKEKRGFVMRELMAAAKRLEQMG